MKVVNHLYPNFEQFAPLAARAGDTAIAMVNLLKFREYAVYPDGRDAQLSGRAAFDRYIAGMGPIVAANGGRFLFSGDVQGLLIGEVDELWDAVGIAEYPSLDAFYRIATSAEVQVVGVHREAGLAGQLLIPTIGRLLPPME